MLYFSVVTITTLGYGDISPVTGAVRFLVGLESVLGIFLLGSFISSLWLRQKERLTRVSARLSSRSEIWRKSNPITRTNYKKGGIQPNIFLREGHEDYGEDHA